MLLPTSHFYKINTWTYASIHVFFCLTCGSYQVLPIIKDAQGQHGLRHGDYQRYRYTKLLISYNIGWVQLAWHKLDMDFMEWPFVTLQQQQQHKLYFHLNFGVASELIRIVLLDVISLLSCTFDTENTHFSIDCEQSFLCSKVCEQARYVSMWATSSDLWRAPVDRPVYEVMMCICHQ